MREGPYRYEPRWHFRLIGVGIAYWEFDYATERDARIGHIKKHIRHTRRRGDISEIQRAMRLRTLWWALAGEMAAEE